MEKAIATAPDEEKARLQQKLQKLQTEAHNYQAELDQLASKSAHPSQSGVPTKTDIQGADFSSIRTPRAGCLFTAVSGSFIVSVAIGS